MARADLVVCGTILVDKFMRHHRSASSCVQEPASAQSASNWDRTSALAGRSAGDFARQARVARSSEAGTGIPLLSEGATGAFCTWARMVAVELVSSNTRRPVSSQ